MSKTLYNIPNLLSYYRILTIPVVTGLFFFDTPDGTLSHAGAVATWISVAVFFFACISDYLDGAIARKTGQMTVFGKFIDSSSDKILIGGMLMLLVSFHRLDGVWVIPALIIFSREILVAGLREFLGLYNISVGVTWIGKLKTAVQMLACGFLLAGNYGNVYIPYAYEFGKAVFLIAMVMTVISGWDYTKAGLETIRKLDSGETL
jgi:cardiolipin synthase